MCPQPLPYSNSSIGYDGYQLVTDSSNVNQNKPLVSRHIKFLESHNLNNGRHDGWRFKLGEKLESNIAHYFILFLVFVDFLVVMIEIGISLSDKNCVIEIGAEHESMLMKILELISIIILSIFIFELVLKLIAFGWRYFAKHFLHLIDAVVVITSLVLIFLVRKLIADEISGFMIIFRFWRVIRIIDSVLMAATTKFEEKIEELEKELNKAYETIKELGTIK